uniref:Pentatricopeptide repeat-containing protein n=1 Tax=Peronospora matthiolae TaxID=2874970 RepID=A0AAV1U715_9STRA
MSEVLSRLTQQMNLPKARAKLLKAFTTVAFIHASRGDLKAVEDVLRDMASQGVATDRMFFDYVLNALYGSCGIDLCFSHLRELSANELAIPDGLYISLIGLGTTIGLLSNGTRDM